MGLLTGNSQYSGVPISGLFYQRWRSRQQVGAARPVVKVSIRKGFFKRDFVPWPGNSFGEHAGGRQGLVWAPRWIPYTTYQDLPNVKEVQIEQSFDNNGIASLTIHMDNLNWKSALGVAGLFHQKQPGYFSPLYGVIPQGLPRSDMVANEWYLEMPNSQILIQEGYGPDTMVKTFTGLIDDINPEGPPDQLILTARDFGGILADQKMYGWVKDPYVPSPVVFAPRGIAENRKRVGGGAKASSEQSGYPARFVVDSGSKGTASQWRSKPRTAPGSIDWIQIVLPAGKYSSIYIDPAFRGQQIYVGMFCRTRDGGGVRLPSRVLTDGSQGIVDLRPENGNMAAAGFSNGVPYGWFNPHNSIVPATDGPNNDGPWPFFMDLKLDRVRPISFGAELEVGANSVLRIGIRSDAATTVNGRRRYQSGLKTLKANKNELTAEAKAKRWIIISDASEIVMCCLRWAGFKDWEIESAGVELKQKYVVAKDKSLMDVIQDVKNQLGYTFFMAEPIQGDDLSIGNPIFRQTRVLNPYAQVDEVRDTDLLENVKVKWSNKQERTHIIVRGKLLKKGKGGEKADGDPNYRASFHYTPPWAFRNAAVLRHLVHYDPKYITKADCAVACYLISLQIALSICTAIVAIPGTPHIGLDTLVSLTDHGTGLYSRMYVSNKRRVMTIGEDTKYQMEIGGSIIDTPDMNILLADLNNGLFQNDRNDRPEE